MTSDPPVAFDVGTFVAATRLRSYSDHSDPKNRELKSYIAVPGDDMKKFTQVPPVNELARFFTVSPDARRASRNALVSAAGEFTGADVALVTLRALQDATAPPDAPFGVVSTLRRATYQPDEAFLRHLTMAARVVIRGLPLQERPKRVAVALTKPERDNRSRDNLRRDEWATATWSLLSYIFCDEAYTPGAPVDVASVLAHGERLLDGWQDYVGEKPVPDAYVDVNGNLDKSAYEHAAEMHAANIEMFTDDHSHVAIPPTPPRRFTRRRVYEVARVIGLAEKRPQNRTVHLIPEREKLNMSDLPVLSRDEILETLLRIAIDANPALFGAEAEGVDISVRMKGGGRFTVSQDAPTDKDADAVRKVSGRITSVLSKGPLSAGRLKNAVAKSFRSYFDEVIETLTADGVIVGDSDASGTLTYALTDTAN